MIQYIKVTISLILSHLAICLYLTLAHIPAQLLIILCNTNDTGSVKSELKLGTVVRGAEKKYQLDK